MSIVMCRAPFRISFFGGGSDYPEWYTARGRRRAVDRDRQVHLHHLPLPAAVPRHQAPRRLALCRAGRTRLPEILHPAVREGLRYLDFDDTLGIELHYQGDLPSRSGMGSSSTFVVALLQALALLARDRGRPPAACRDGDRARTGAHEGNRGFAGPGRCGLRRAQCHQVPPGRPLRRHTRFAWATQRERDLLANLMLFFPGRSRFSSDAAISVTQNLTKRSNSVRRMVAMVEEGVEILRRGDLHRLRAPAARGMGDEARPERSRSPRTRSTISTIARGARERSAASCSAQAAPASSCCSCPGSASRR